MKITGIALLAILILIVCLALTVLFVPLRYRVKALFGENNTKAGGKGAYSVSVKARWLLGLVSVEYIYPSEEKSVIKLFFIPLKRRKRKNNKNNKVKKSDKSGHENSTAAADKNTGSEKIKSPEASFGRKKDTSKQKRKKSKKDRKPKEKKDILKKIRSYYGIFSAPENKGAYGFIKKSLFSLIKHSAPETLNADMVIGLDNPCNTGLLFGGLGLVITFVKGKYNLRPDFYNKRLDGRIYAKGKIRSAVVIYHLVRVLVNKDIKNVMSQFKTIR